MASKRVFNTKIIIEVEDNDEKIDWFEYLLARTNEKRLKNGTEKS